MGDDAAGRVAAAELLAAEAPLGGFLAMAGFSEGGEGRCSVLLSERWAAAGRR